MRVSRPLLQQFHKALGQLREDLAAYREECRHLRESGQWGDLSPEALEALQARGDVLRSEYQALRAQFLVTRQHFRAYRVTEH